jgi:hypothetical protein
VNGSSPAREADALRVAGIDWATEPGNRALVELRLDRGRRRVRVERISSPVPDEDCLEATGRQSLAVLGVDVPFRWPAPFVEFVGGWPPSGPSGDLALPSRDRFSFRTTDLHVAGHQRDHRVRARMLGSLFELFRVERSREDEATLASSGTDSDKSDAFVAALTALAYAEERVRRPSAEQQEAARRESWIFFIE